MTTFLNKQTALNTVTYAPVQRPLGAPGDTYQYYPWMSVKANDGIFHDKLEVMNDEGLVVGGQVLSADLAYGFSDMFIDYTVGGPSTKAIILAAGASQSFDMTGGTQTPYTTYPASTLTATNPGWLGGVNQLMISPFDENYMVDVEVTLEISVVSNQASQDKAVFTFRIDQPLNNIVAYGKLELNPPGNVGQGISGSTTFIVKGWPGRDDDVWLGRLWVTSEGTQGLSLLVDTVHLRARRLTDFYPAD